MEEEFNNPIYKLRELYNTPDEQSAVRTICRRLLSSLNLRQPPIAMQPICRRMRLSVNYTNAHSAEDSILKLAPQGFSIDISRRKNWRRNRFTIAHEVVHLLLYNMVEMPLQSYNPTDYEVVERLCDVGASELLISEDSLLNALNSSGLGTESLERLYDLFLVSYDALLLKLADFLSASITIWKQHARHNAEKSELRVVNHFPKYRYADKATWLPTGCTTKHIFPDIITQAKSTKFVTLEKNFQLIMGKRKTDCFSICFPFPLSRINRSMLPMFEQFVVSDESAYDNCFVMLTFATKESFDFAVSNFIRES